MPDEVKKPAGECKVRWCKRKARARGYCTTHYMENRRWEAGESERAPGTPPRTARPTVSGRVSPATLAALQQAAKDTGKPLAWVVGSWLEATARRRAEIVAAGPTSP